VSNLGGLVKFSRVATNGIELHVAEAGPPDAPLVFLLHGFPEFWYSWRNQMAALAGGGYHVIAPDQRGYNLSGKPHDASSYHLDHLAADIVGLADSFGQEAFSLVGHDWGASVGWWLAGKYPKRLRRLAVLNAPHPAVWVEAMHANAAQRRKSRYVRFLQLPYLPEFLLSLGNYGALAKSFQQCTRPGAFTEADLSFYRTAWRQPGAITAMINWYRALLKRPPASPKEYRVSCPTMLIWGMRDAYAEPVLAEASARLCLDSRIEYLEQATHWSQHDEPNRVIDLLLPFLKP
jgi:pimeloyl-ACP methyl ester carboxylesterase